MALGMIGAPAVWGLGDHGKGARRLGVKSLLGSKNSRAHGLCVTVVILERNHYEGKDARRRVSRPALGLSIGGLARRRNADVCAAEQR